MSIKDKQSIIEIAKKTIQQESDTILRLIDEINDDFAVVVDKISSSKGRVIFSGIGKSAIIAQKIVATLNSTGTPSVFMHAADAIHGDLGIIQPDDIVICISKSGNTPEIKVLAPLIKSLGNLLIGIVADKDSYLAKSSDYILGISVTDEACPNNLVPTSSTTAQLVMGDAMAIALLHLKGFTKNDFARLHPGGSLGKKLYLKVDDIYIQNEMPKVKISSNINDIITEISAKRLGATAVVDDDEMLLGVITDGDVRRMLNQHKANIFKIAAIDLMNKNPKIISKGELAVNALRLIKSENVSQVIVVDDDRYLGIVHFHDLMREGIV